MTDDESEQSTALFVAMGLVVGAGLGVSLGAVVGLLLASTGFESE